MMQKVLLATIVGAAVAYLPSAMADEALAKAKFCTGCHAIDKKVVGPAYKDVAAKYAGKAGADATLANSILKGSKGVFGDTAVMPPNQAVTPEEAAKLAKWVLSLK